jgi:hypothetical protein
MDRLLAKGGKVLKAIQHSRASRHFLQKRTAICEVEMSALELNDSKEKL